MKLELTIKRRATILEELERLLANPRAEEIIANDWLHDGSLPVPSLDLIRYLGCRMLTGHGIKLAATSNDRYGLIKKLVKHLRKESPKDRQSLLDYFLNGLDTYKFLNTSGKQGACDKFAHEWMPVLWPFLYPDAPMGDPDRVALAAGERMIARGLIETMILRAIFTQDHERVKSLSSVMKRIRHRESTKPTLENRIKGGILRSLPYLSQNLGRQPSRAEIQCFIREFASINGEPDFPERQNPWIDAFDEFNYKGTTRRIRMDKDLIVRLAREARYGMG